MKLYKDVLAKGWHLTTKHSWLWFFGFFALLINGNGSEYDFYLRNVERLTGNDSILSLGFWQGKGGFFIANIINLITTNPLQFSLLAIIFLTAVAVLIYFILISQISLIFAADQENKELTFNSCFHESRKHIKPVLLTNIICKCLNLIILFLLTWPIMSLSKSSDYGNVFFAIGLIILIPLVLGISFINKYAINYIVIKKQTIKKALYKALVLFGKNWLVSLEMALIVFIISIILGLVLLFGTGIFMTPFIMVSLTGLYAKGLLDFSIVLLISTVVFMAFTLLASSVFSTWQCTSWTFLYKELTRGPKKGKLLRVFEKK